MLGHVLGRLEQSKQAIEIVVATSTQHQDDAIVAFCETQQVHCFRGSEADVLDRYYQCAQQFRFAHVVRLTADNPFTDIVELDRLIALHRSNGNAFTHSFGTLPLGVGAEIFSLSALEKSWREGLASHHREHVDEYLLEHPDKFKTGILDIPTPKVKPELRLTVDTEDDWRLADSLARQAGHEWLTTERIIALCSPSA